MTRPHRSAPNLLLLLGLVAAAGNQAASADDTARPSSRPRKAAVEAPKDAGVEDKVRLESVKFDQFLARMKNPRARYTMVDVWATWCGPCKKNFPHVVEMHAKYAGKGLAVASLSFDTPSDPKQVHDARQFLVEQKAVSANSLPDEDGGVANEKQKITPTPAVFIFGPDGKEVKRFTLDDPNHQFEYKD